MNPTPHNIPTTGPLTAPLSQQELDTLDLLCGAATPGPWFANTENPKKWVTKPGVSDEAWAANRHNDALFVAAANPETISRLVRQVMALQERARALSPAAPGHPQQP